MPDTVRSYGDFVLPFDLPKAGVRGRLVRLDASSARALRPMPCRKTPPAWSAKAWRWRPSWGPPSSWMAA